MPLLRTGLVLLVLTLLGAAGFAAGLRAGPLLRALGFASGAPVRPPALEAAWRAADRENRQALRLALDALGDAPLPTPAFEAERDLLRALARDDPAAAVAAVAARHEGLPAGAMALAWLVDHAPDPTARRRWRARLRAAYPASWRLEEHAAPRTGSAGR